MPLELRRGLPFGFLASCGLQAEVAAKEGKGAPGAEGAAKALAAGLRALAAQVGRGATARTWEGMPTSLLTDDFAS